jgi:hypothetical protein
VKWKHGVNGSSPPEDFNPKPGSTPFMAVRAAGVGFEPTNEHSPVAGFQDLVLVIETSMDAVRRLRHKAASDDLWRRVAWPAVQRLQGLPGCRPLIRYDACAGCCGTGASSSNGLPKLVRFEITQRMDALQAVVSLLAPVSCSDIR